MTNKLKRDIMFLLQLLSDRDNWEYREDYGKYGAFITCIWNGSYDPKALADDILNEMQKGDLKDE